MTEFHSDMAEVLHDYNEEIYNLQAKLQQQRRLHEAELAGAFLEGNVAAPQATDFINMVAGILADRADYNQRKQQVDASEWAIHEAKLGHALGKQSDVLRGGASALIPTRSSKRSMDKRLLYSAKRSNALVWHLNKNLAHDRQVHAMELRNIYDEALKQPLPQEYKNMLGLMVDDRTMFDGRRAALDAAQWSKLDTTVEQTLGGGAVTDEILGAGADYTYDEDAALAGGAVDSATVRRMEQNLEEAWRQIAAASTYTQ